MDRKNKVINMALISLIIFSIIGYVLGRIFYTPEKMCYINHVGFRTESQCKSYGRAERLKQIAPEIIEEWDLRIQKIKDEILIEQINKQLKKDLNILYVTGIPKFMEYL